MLNVPSLGHPDDKKDSLLHSHASDTAVGAVLTQYKKSDESNTHSSALLTIDFYLRTLTDVESRHGIADKEVLALVEGRTFQTFHTGL